MTQMKLNREIDYSLILKKWKNIFKKSISKNKSTVLPLFKRNMAKMNLLMEMYSS